MRNSQPKTRKGAAWKLTAGIVEPKIRFFWFVFLLWAGAVRLFALSTLPLKLTVQQGETVLFSPAFRDSSAITGPLTIQIVTPPSHGRITLRDSTYWFRNFPFSGFCFEADSFFTGEDTFSWSIRFGDGRTDTGIVTIKAHPPEPGNMKVVLYINEQLYPKITGEISRLSADLEKEGYRVKIRLRSISTGNLTAIRDSLRVEYDEPGSWLVGAILIGNVPSSEILWCMLTWGSGYDTLTAGFEGRNCRQIWVSRIYLPPTYALYGDEAVLIKRALDANHAYRTGEQRLPHTAWHWNNLMSGDPNLKPSDYLAIYPQVDTLPWEFRPGGGPQLIDKNCWTWSDCFVRSYEYKKGGELYDYINHVEAGVTADQVMESTVPFRALLSNACAMSAYAAIHLFARGGGCVFTVSSLVELHGYFALYSLLDTLPEKIQIRHKLAQGTRWGRAWLQCDMPIINTELSGDPTIKPLMAPSNALPIITRLSVDTVSGSAPLTVNFSGQAQDDDGTITNYEWFAEDYNIGRAMPDSSGPNQTTLRHTFTKPVHYKTRLEVVDNYKARTYQNIDIAVAPGANDTLRVRCGHPFLTRGGPFKYETRWETRDNQGNLWLPDQEFFTGTWGSNGAFQRKIEPSGLIPSLPDLKLGVSTQNMIFSKIPMTRKDSLLYPFKDISYRIPLQNGTYTLRLGFKDFHTSVASKACVMDIDAENSLWKQALCPYTTAGKNIALFIDTVLMISDGELNFTVRQNSGKPTDIFLNCFEVIPGDAIAIEKNISNTTDEFIQIFPSPFNPIVTIRLNNPDKTPISGILLFDLAGHRIRSLGTGNHMADEQGSRTYFWDGTDDSGHPLASGVYCLQIRCGTKTLRRQIILAR